MAPVRYRNRRAERTSRAGKGAAGAALGGCRREQGESGAAAADVEHADASTQPPGQRQPDTRAAEVEPAAGERQELGTAIRVELSAVPLRVEHRERECAGG